MRNLAEYPITNGEIIECLKRLRTESLRSDAIGDIELSCLTKAIELIERLQKMEEWVKEAEGSLGRKPHGR